MKPVDTLPNRTQPRAPAGTAGRLTWVWMDVSATCNLACDLCYTVELQSKAKMTMPTFVEIVDRLGQGGVRLASLHLNWRGEPTSNRLLPDMLAHLAQIQLGCGVEWHTNGTLISPARAKRYVEALPDQMINVSLDGGNAESFESTRGVGNWDRALAGLEALLAARGNRPVPRLGIYQLDLGVPREDYDPRFSALIEQVDAYHCVAPVDPDGGIVGSNAPVPRGPCFWLGNTLAIDCRGTAYTCLLATATPLGSLLETDAATIMSRAASMREIVAFGGRRTIAGCRRCRKCEGSAHRMDSVPD
jgi:hypothetical protein